MNIKNQINLISDLNIGPQQLVMLALVILKEKPAVEIELYSYNKIDSYDFVTLLGSIGLAAYTTRLNIDKAKSHVATICVSTNPADAALLKFLVEIRDTTNKMSKSFHVAYGTLMGYPLSAIEGFISDQKISNKDLKDMDELLVFRPSKNNFTEEIKTIDRWRKSLSINAENILKIFDDNLIKK